MAKADYKTYSRKELISEVKKLKRRKKYGIVWEEKPEKVVELCKEKLPVLKEVKNKEINTDKNEPVNILIEGDNYHALTVLNYTHRGRVDVIYIDPPYNTGKKNEWKYNDRYVDEEDTYRHSKWLSFMAKRLKLAKNLLKNTGVIFIAIDDNEMPQLKLLCDEIFGEKSFIATVCWKSRDSISNDLIISQNHNYHLVYAKKFKEIFDRRFGFRLPKEPEGFKNPDNDPHGPWKLMPVDGPGGAAKGNPYFEFLGIKGYWRYSEETMRKLYESGQIVKSSTGRSIQRKYYLKDAKGKGISATTWWDDVGTTTKGTKELIEILGDKVFSNPKPTSLIEKILILATDNNKDYTILDFFAGSGTTGHAVLKMNKQDGGRRKFILCTNDENRICTEICYPRISKVIKGYDYSGKEREVLLERKVTLSLLKNSERVLSKLESSKEENKARFNKFQTEIRKGVLHFLGIRDIKGTKEGLGGNLKYYTTEFVDAEPTDRNKKKLVDQSTEMLCLREDCFDEVKFGQHYKIFRNSYGTYLGIVYEDDGIEPLKKEVKRINKKTNVYVFSLDASAREEEFEDMIDLVNLRPIPEVILNVYRRIFK